MNITKIIIHELIKEVNRMSAKTDLSQHLLPINEDSTKLIEKLNNSYNKDNVTYAVFENSQDKVFPASFNSYVESAKEESDFNSFTSLTLNTLRDQISNVNLAKGGFFIYSEYSANGYDFIGIYLIRDTEGILFRKNESESMFQIDTINYLNTDKLAMGCRINITKFKNADGKYITFIKNKQKDISDYFINWISAYQPESSTEFTNALYQIANSIPRPINDNNIEMSIDEFRKSIYDFIYSEPQKIINLNNLSRHFYPDDELLFKRKADEMNIEIDTEFRADRRSLKKFIRVEINADGIHLRFSRGELDTKIKFNVETPNTILIESKAFVDAFKREINATS